jgi:cytochrome b involved in lipid metabolism
LLPGRVYNVTHYMDFHPGGDAELMRGVGQDGTNLFSQVGSTAVSLEATRNAHKILFENYRTMRTCRYRHTIVGS